MVLSQHPTRFDLDMHCRKDNVIFEHKVFIESDSGYNHDDGPRDTEVTEFTVGPHGNFLRCNTPR